MKEHSPISWEKYLSYTDCPQQYLWEFITTRETRSPFKDTQHLVRGNAIQALVGTWAREGMWKSSPSEATTQIGHWLDQGVALRQVQTSWIQDQKRGKPHISAIMLATDVERLIIQFLPKLHAMLWQPNDSPPDKVLGEEDALCEWDHPKAVWEENGQQYRIKLMSRMDLVSFRDGQATIYEGKATRHPEYVFEDQVRWQAAILNKSGQQLSLNQYYVFYHTSEIRPVLMTDTEGNLSSFQRNWQISRDRFLERLVDGNFTATPSHAACQYCVHARHCPDKYTAKKRVIPDPPAIKLPPGRRITTI